MTVVDWRHLSTARAEALVAGECRWWQEHLGWDLASSWAAVEPARAAGLLPGLVVENDRGDVVAWTFFLRHRQSLQVAAVLADTRETLATLLDAIGDSPEARGADIAIVFARTQAPGLSDECAVRGYRVEPYAYLEAPTHAFDRPVQGIRPWVPSDRGAASALLEVAYAPTRSVRPFAPDGRSDEWREYVDQLIASPACGAFAPDLSVAWPGDRSDRPAGLALATAIGPGTAHLAQIAVDPAAQGQGGGRHLVSAVGAAARRHGFTRLTLFVAAENAPARKIYAHAGFRETGRFLAAVRRA